jgi:hypothetical protein
LAFILEFDAGALKDVLAAPNGAQGFVSERDPLEDRQSEE